MPPRNVRVFLEDMLRRGELKTVNEVLMKYAACIALGSAGGAAHHGDWAFGFGGIVWQRGRQRADGSNPPAGESLAIEREPEVQTLVSATFVRMSQEAASKRCYPAMQQALASLDSIEAQRPGSTQSLRPRIGAEERVAGIY